MREKEYLTVNDISKHYKTTSRNVRRIASKLQEDKNEYLIYKYDGQWKVHHLLLAKFKPQRLRTSKYYALTIRPNIKYSREVLKEMMKMVYKECNDDTLEINYTIEESKRLDNHHHIHCYIKTKRKRELTKHIKDMFFKIDYKQNNIYDLESWIGYITKGGSPIITLKNYNYETTRFRKLND